MKTLLTASRMAALLRCPRFHFLRYELRLRPVEKSGALRFGSAWHKALELRAQGRELGDAFAATLAAFPGALDELQVAMLSGMLAGYYANYLADDLLAFQAEIEFRHPIDGSRGFDAAGKIDGLAVAPSGRRVLVEHKTAGEDIGPESDYWLRLLADKQLAQYTDAAIRLGQRPDYALYDVARKPAIRPLAATAKKAAETFEAYADRLAADTQERPGFYFARREIPIIDADLEAFRVERLACKDMILAFRSCARRARNPADAWPRNVSAMVCKTCEYRAPCLQNLRPDAQAPWAGFTTGPENEELAGTKPEEGAVP